MCGLILAKLKERLVFSNRSLVRQGMALCLEQITN